MEEHILSEYLHIVDHLERTGHYACFEFAGVALGWYCDDPDTITWLSRYCAGYFIPSSRRKADAIMYSTQDPAFFHLLRARVASDGFSHEKTYTEVPLDAHTSLIHDSELDSHNRSESVCFVLSKPERHIVIAYPGSTQNRRWLALRTLRNLMKLLLIEKGWLPLHATACVRDGIGIGLVGGKFAGKTSTLINLLSRPGAKLVANDKLFVRDAGTHIEGCGFPNQATIRVGLLLTHPKWQRWIEQTTETFHPRMDAETLRAIASTTPAGELNTRPESIRLAPTELVDLLEISIEPVTAIKLFLVVHFEPEREASCLVPVAHERITHSLTPHFRPLAKEKQGYLQGFFDYTDEMLWEQFSALLAAYSSTIAVQELHQSEKTNQHSEALIKAYIGQLV